MPKPLAERFRKELYHNIEDRKQITITIAQT
jgi:hypothetical protein